jgi:hypothetical protein
MAARVIVWGGPRDVLGKPRRTMSLDLTKLVGQIVDLAASWILP